ncbi:extensin family protein [Devosia sp. MC1541]|uniref:extensin-like domain-containing protein n=1 Tax=Devosia sp. MC1541 TaxID=2725264 RepID=UPI00145E20FE|nr:extensin family protein [Devosia sp. MC1541]
MQSPSLALVTLILLSAASPAQDNAQIAPAPFASQITILNNGKSEPTALAMPTPRPEVRPVAPTSDQPTEKPEETEPAPVAERASCPALKNGTVIGEMIAPISEGRCGTASPILMTGVKVGRRDIPLAMPATVTCGVATAVADWVAVLDAQAQELTDSPLASVTSGGSMVCRARIGTRSGGVSEHSFANALDIHGFILGDGRVIDVLKDWRPSDALEGQFLTFAQQAACERFNTVLGPDANAAHANHFHVDAKCRGDDCAGRYCQ